MLAPIAVCGAIGLFVAGCADEAPPETGAAAPAASAPGAPDAEALAQLRALGYLDVSPDLADPSRRGAEVLDRERAMPGYRLYTSYTRCSASLIDLEGRVVHRWKHPCKRWKHAELLPDGHLLAVASLKRKDVEPGAERRAVVKLDWDGNRVWAAAIPAHHDVERTPTGEVLALTRRPANTEGPAPRG